MDHPPFSSTTPPGHSLTYPDGGYNNEWGPEQALFNFIIQLTDGETPTAGSSQATSNDGHQHCKWLAPDGIPCNQSFPNFNDLVEHLGRVHDVQGPASRKIVCQWLLHTGCCGQKYRRGSFRRHISTHVRRSFRCADCGKPFSRKDSLNAHSRKQHGRQ